MKVIKDIRLFKSTEENVDGYSPQAFEEKPLLIVLHRVVMKLREQSFSLGDFDHLYINFTTCLAPEDIQPANRSIDGETRWFRYYDVGVSFDFLDLLGAECNADRVLELIKITLHFCCPQEENRLLIEQAFHEAISLGKNMPMKYREKRSANRKAVIYLYYDDQGKYQAELCVTDESGTELLKEKMPLSYDLLSLGEIQLNSKKVAIKPRKNAFSKHRPPISFDIPSCTP